MNEREEKKRLCLQVNYYVIDRIWANTKGGEYSKQELYNLIGITKNLFSTLRTGNYSVNFEKLMGRKDGKLKNIGLDDIMTGKEMIIIKDIKENEWTDYFGLKYKYEENIEESDRNGKLYDFRKKVDSVINSCIKEENTSNSVYQLYYYFKNGTSIAENIPDRKIIILKEKLKDITNNEIKRCDSDIKKEVYEELQKMCRKFETVINYEKL